MLLENLDSYKEGLYDENSPINQIQVVFDKTFEDLQDELSDEDNQIIENHIWVFENKANEAQNRVKYALVFKELVKEYLLLKEFPLELTSDEKLKLSILEFKIKNMI